MVNDTRLDPDYLGREDGTDPGSELSLPIVVAESNWGVLNLEQRERGAFGEEDLLLAHVVAGQIGAAIHRCQLVGELEDAFLTTIGVISDAVEMQDSYTADHAHEVSDLAVRVGERMGSTASSSTASAMAPSSTTSARSASPRRSSASPGR
jgi:HD-GYP domain-containing protein (c-di-GMP phosphodiesterase class II)